MSCNISSQASAWFLRHCQTDISIFSDKMSVNTVGTVHEVSCVIGEHQSVKARNLVLNVIAST